MASSYEELIQAKKEAVGLQLEAEYRSRLQNAYTQVKYFSKDKSFEAFALSWDCCITCHYCFKSDIRYRKSS